MDKKRMVGDVLKAAITDTKEKPGGRLYDLAYVIVTMKLYQWLDLERYWYMFEEFFDIIIELEKMGGGYCGRSVSAQEIPKVKDVSHFIHNVVNILTDIANKRRYTTEELIQDLMLLPVEENVYLNFVLLREYLLYSILVDHYLYYIHDENNAKRILRRIPISEFLKEWKPEQGEYILANVSRCFYVEKKGYISLQLLSEKTSARYYPVTGIIETKKIK